jgi:hypothetical protein
VRRLSSIILFAAACVGALFSSVRTASAAAPYSLPWQLRPVSPGNVVRSDNVFANYEDAKANRGFTIVNMLSGSYKVIPDLAVFGKLTTSQDSPPSGNGGFVMDNPAVGAVYGLARSDFRAGFYLSATIPVGGGGGDSPSAGALDARKAGAPARLSFDNSIFAPNDVAIVPGVDVAYVAHDFTAQFEVTYFELHRVRGEAAQHEEAKRNLTSGLHLGYFLLPALSVGGELRYQHWLNPPFFTPGNDSASNPAIDQWSFAAGARFHVPLGETFWVRPGVSYGRGLDLPLAGATPNYHVAQLDIPFAF